MVFVWWTHVSDHKQNVSCLTYSSSRHKMPYITHGAYSGIFRSFTMFTYTVNMVNARGQLNDIYHISRKTRVAFSLNVNLPHDCL